MPGDARHPARRWGHPHGPRPVWVRRTRSTSRSGPGLTLAGCRLPDTLRHRRGFPCCYRFPLAHVPAPLPRWDSRMMSLITSGKRRPSLKLRQVGSHVTRFEACSAFTHVPACVLAKSPKATLYTRGFDGFVTSTAAPVASGWSDQLPGGIPHPLGISAFPRRTELSGLATRCRLRPAGGRAAPDRRPGSRRRARRRWSAAARRARAGRGSRRENRPRARRHLETPGRRRRRTR